MSTLNISPVTQEILKNFSKISDHIILNPGTTQRTLLQSKSVFAIAELPEAWPQETAIYRLQLFTQVLAQFDKPSISFGADGMTVFQEVGTKLRHKHRFSDATTIEAAPARTLPSDNPAIELTVSSYTMGVIKKNAALLKLTHFTVVVENGDVKFVASDPKIPNSHEFEIGIHASDVTVHDASFSRSLRFSVEHFGYLLDGDYIMALKDWKYAYFTNKAVPVSYFVAEDKQVD
jgi:hypothetical protein